MHGLDVKPAQCDSRDSLLSHLLIKPLEVTGAVLFAFSFFLAWKSELQRRRTHDPRLDPAVRAARSRSCARSTEGFYSALPVLFCLCMNNVCLAFKGSYALCMCA